MDRRDKIGAADKVLKNFAIRFHKALNGNEGRSGQVVSAASVSQLRLEVAGAAYDWAHLIGQKCKRCSGDLRPVDGDHCPVCVIAIGDND